MCAQSLEDRMLSYSEVFSRRLIKRMPVIIKIDIHNVDSGYPNNSEPFDPNFMTILWNSAIDLCKTITSAKMGYVEYNSISILLNDYETLDEKSWYGYNVSKIETVAASIISVNLKSPVYCSAKAWNLTKEEVANYFIWRQTVFQKYSINRTAKKYLTREEYSECSGRDDAKEILKNQYNINWDEFPQYLKRGACVIMSNGKAENEIDFNSEWIIDVSLPVFTNNRNYIDVFVK